MTYEAGATSDRSRLLFAPGGLVDFGKLEDLEAIARIDFRLPDEPARTSALFVRMPPPPAGEAWLVLGAPAWARKDWLGKLYPPGTAPRDFLKTYARLCGAIELNATYYTVPEE